MSVIERLNSEFTDAALERMVLDPAIAKGSKFLFDFKNPYCNNLAEGALSSGAELKNLVDGAPSLFAVNSGSPLVNQRTTTGGLKYPNAASTGMSLEGAAGEYIIPPGHSYVATLWLKSPASPLNASAYAPLSTIAGGSVQNTLFSIDSGEATTNIPRANANNQSNSPVYATYSGVVGGSVRQVAIAWRPGFVERYVDGVLQATSGNANANILDHSAFKLISSGSRTNTTIYRMGLEDVTASGRSIAAAVGADFAAGSARGFS